MNRTYKVISEAYIAQNCMCSLLQICVFLGILTKDTADRATKDTAGLSSIVHQRKRASKVIIPGFGCRNYNANNKFKDIEQFAKLMSLTFEGGNIRTGIRWVCSDDMLAHKTQAITGSCWKSTQCD